MFNLRYLTGKVYVHVMLEDLLAMGFCNVIASLLLVSGTLCLGKYLAAGYGRVVDPRCRPT
jgi:hypothetical protein